MLKLVDPDATEAVAPAPAPAGLIAIEGAGEPKRIEEATTLTSRKHQDISTCCRTSKPNWRPRIYSTTNPGGIGHAWYRAKFVVPFLQGNETDTRFVPARVTDNGFNNPEYRRVLEALTGWQKRAWLDGDWDIAAGQFFTTLRRDVHVISSFDDKRAVEWFAAMDYGFTHYTVVLLGCRDGDGNIFVVDEHAERMWLPQRHAPAIVAMLGRHQISNSASREGARPLEISDLKRFVAGADVFSKQSDGSTVASQYAKLGISLKVANTERVSGWAEVLHRLGDPANGVPPRLFIHERCARLIECLPALQHDPNRPEDVLKVDADEDGVGGDDTADCLRYLVATKSRAVTQRKLRGLTGRMAGGVECGDAVIQSRAPPECARILLDTEALLKDSQSELTVRSNGYFRRFRRRRSSPSPYAGLDRYPSSDRRRWLAPLQSLWYRDA